MDRLSRRRTLAALSGLSFAALLRSRASAENSAQVLYGKSENSKDERRRRFAGAEVWGCQFQNIDINQIAASNLDFIAVDHALGEVGPVVARAADVARLKAKPDGSRRVVLAYLSVGEAENFRPYWRAEWASQPPSWMGPANPNWPGAYVAKYWDRSWQEIVFRGPDSILEGIVNAGFDGVFLDRVDAYIDWESNRPAAQDEMVELVSALADAARAKDPQFLVLSQNAEPLLRRRAYRDLIDAVSKECLLYGLSAPEALNSDREIAWSLAGLNAAHADGIPVYAIEYLSDPEKIEEAGQRLRKLGFHPFFANRALDRLPV